MNTKRFCIQMTGQIEYGNKYRVCRLVRDVRQVAAGHECDYKELKMTMQGLLLTFKSLANLGDRHFITTLQDVCKKSKVASLIRSYEIQNSI